MTILQCPQHCSWACLICCTYHTTASDCQTTSGHDSLGPRPQKNIFDFTSQRGLRLRGSLLVL